MPGTFRSAILLVNEASDSVRTTIPGGVAEILGAAPGGVLVWSVDLKAGRVTVTAESLEMDRAGRKASRGS